MRLISLLLCLALAGCGSPADDLNTICEEAQKSLAMDVPAEQRAAMLAKAIDERLESAPIKQAWGAIWTVAPDQRYKLLQTSAAEIGVDNWQCPALEKVWAPQQPQTHPPG